MTKLQAERWKTMPEGEKATYEKQAAEAKAKYEKDLAAFKEAGGEVGKARKDKKDAKAAKADKAAKKEANADRPKRPAGGAYGVFMSENRNAIQESLPAGSAVTAVSKAGGEKWKLMSEAEKKPYEAKYQQLKAKYEEEIKAWKDTKGETASADDDEEEASPDSKKRLASPAKETSPTKKSKGVGKSRAKDKKSEPSVEMDDEIMAKASKLNLELQLKNLASRADMKGISPDKLLTALENSNGLVNRAKAAILGA